MTVAPSCAFCGHLQDLHAGPIFICSRCLELANPAITAASSPVLIPWETATWTIRRQSYYDHVSESEAPFAWQFTVYLSVPHLGGPLVNAVRLRSTRNDWPDASTAECGWALLRQWVEEEVVRRRCGAGADSHDVPLRPSPH